MILIFIGVFKQPYGYYEFLRIFVFLNSIFLTKEAFKNVKRNGFEYLYLSLLILFNPIIPIYSTKVVWVLLDIISVLLLIITLVFDRPENYKKQ
ncbi:DUF6804 family protein [Bacillus sp. 1NLA3E]|uniref:DUF6804 family protein n=1 Tax=Bacillus sp. 1NLA3E TaxID=666686 RepID=UPI000247F0DC|nr:hypothetical protein B1NLA3E_09350 [Bacillus sp. 1NLA3E]